MTAVMVRVPSRLKTCTRCERLLPKDRFYSHPTGKDGLRSQCKDCILAQTSAWQKAHPKPFDREVYERQSGESNRKGSRARQRAYRELARRHPDEFDHILRVERALENLETKP